MNNGMTKLNITSMNILNNTKVNQLTKPCFGRTTKQKMMILQSVESKIKEERFDVDDV